MHPAQLTEQINQAQALEKTPIPTGATIPFWRNFYSLHIKQSSTSAPIVKDIYMEGGFTAVKAVCEKYCADKQYRFLTLCPKYSDLMFEMTGENSFVKDSTKDRK